MKRLLLLKSTAAPPLETQLVAALPFGFKRADMESFYGGEGIYVDQRGVGQQLGKWTEAFIDQTEPRDTPHIFDLSILGTKIDIVAERLTRLATKCKTLRLTSTGTIIRLTPETIDLLVAMQVGRKSAAKRRMDHANAARRRNGVKVGSKPRWNDEHKAICRTAWRASKTQDEVILRVKQALDGRSPNYSQIHRWANPNEEARRKGAKPWGPRGADRPNAPKPKSKRRRSKR